jgi:hypothetical protein
MEEVLRHYIRTHGFREVQETLTALAAEYRAFYEGELAFLSGHVQQVPPTPQPTPLIVPMTLNEFIEEQAQQPVDEVKVVQITAPAAAKAEEVMDAKEFTLEGSVATDAKKHKMKVIRKGNRVIPVPEIKAQNVELAPEEAPIVEDMLQEQQQPVQFLIVLDESHQQQEQQEQSQQQEQQEQSQQQEQQEQSQQQEQQEQQPQKRTPAEIKKWQREQEAARKAFMKANKISRASLMTVENVRKWLADGDTYAKIAREQLGCKEEEVSKFAKEHGLQRKSKK